MSEYSRPYDSVIAAKYLLAIGYEKEVVLNVTKVQKLLYMAYGYFLGRKKVTIFKETPKAWPYGPVFPRTRKKVDYSKIVSVSNPELSEIIKDTELKDFFHKLVDKYSKYTASQLSEWSHAKGGPWDIAINQDGVAWNTPIPDSLIESYFSKLNI